MISHGSRTDHATRNMKSGRNSSSHHELGDWTDATWLCTEMFWGTAWSRKEWFETGFSETLAVDSENRISQTIYSLYNQWKWIKEKMWKFAQPPQWQSFQIKATMGRIPPLEYGSLVSVEVARQQVFLLTPEFQASRVRLGCLVSTEGVSVSHWPYFHMQLTLIDSQS